MVVHEIVAIRKGGHPSTKAVELNLVENSWEPEKGLPSVAATIHIEHTRDALEEMLGAGYDVGDRVELVDLTFRVIEEKVDA